MCLDDARHNGAERPMRLDYYLDELDGAPQGLYGGGCGCYGGSGRGNPACAVEAVPFCIRVTKEELDAFEEARFEDVTHDFEGAKRIVLLLAENLVTPCCLLEILEEIYTVRYMA
ncbi:MAG: DUF6514 family protein [Oscillospiraceae bacterium]|nr:DUF6514 family protein [Oscillospiraceae bacterium]